MECFGPISIMRRGQNDPRVRDVVPCGRCAACLHNRRAEWVTRLEQEMKVSATAHFVTLTYHDPPEGDGGFFSLHKPDFQLFMKRLRKRVSGKLKYYAVGEYGSKTLRPHYHAIIFNLPGNPLPVLYDAWNLGIVHVGSVTSASIRYTLKYIMFSKKDSSLYEYVEPVFSLMSKGLGRSYIDSRKAWHVADIQRNYVVKANGEKSRLPRYFRDKIYSDEQKKQQRLIYEEERNKFEVRTAVDFKDEHERKFDYQRKTEKSLKGSERL